MEAADRAERLRRLQAYGTQRAAERGFVLDDIRALVDRILDANKRA